MNKKIYTFGLALVAFAATSCSDNSLESAQPQPAANSFRIIANDLSFNGAAQTTRTTLDGSTFGVAWNATDNLSVFNAETGTTNYSGNLKFDIDNTATGAFAAAEGVSVPFVDGTSYDWYVCSPYNEYFIDPVGTSAAVSGAFPIGVTTQAGYGSTDHIAQYDIMVGKATNTRTPNITMHHLGTLMKFTVKNTTATPITVNSISVDAGTEIIAGGFVVDFTADTPAIDKTNMGSASYTSRTLTVTDGTALAENETADFYMLLAPFTISAGNSIIISVATNEAPCTVVKTATTDLVFGAGKYNTATINYTPDAPSNSYLYYETFDGTGEYVSTWKNATSNAGNSRLNIYKGLKSGLSTYYNSDVAIVDYQVNSYATLSSYVAASAIIGMNEVYVWLTHNASGEGAFTVKNIPLYGKTALTVSFLQTYKNSKVLVEYSVDGGTTWLNIDDTTNPETATCETRSFDFNVAAGSTTIFLRFTKNDTTANAPRIDNIKLAYR